MPPVYDAVLLVAFGGPTAPDEIRPFLARVLAGTPVPAERIEEVVCHYHAVGGRSPLNEITFRQAAALERELGRGSLRVPVYVGLRHARPTFLEALRKMAAAGVRRALCLILSAHQTEASWDRYRESLSRARAELGPGAPALDYGPPWFNHPLFVETWKERIERSLAGIPEARRSDTRLVFTAHSVPVTMAVRSPYVEQLRKSASLVARALDRSSWSLAFQSRSGRPTDAWLEPDIGSEIRELAGRGARDVLVAPIGFVCDHVEILYDLDIEARRTAAASRVHFWRAGCPNDHPTFIAMLADVVSKAAGHEPATR